MTQAAFVSKVNPANSTLVYSTYLKGSMGEEATGVAVDSNANAYVTGLTYSPNFPTVNALQPAYGGAGDAFFAKVNTNGSGASSLVYSTFLGGSNLDQGNGVAVDSNGIAYIAGFAGAGTLPFTTIGALCLGTDLIALITSSSATFSARPRIACRAAAGHQSSKKKPLWMSAPPRPFW